MAIFIIGRCWHTWTSVVVLLSSCYLLPTAVDSQKLLFGYQIQNDVSDYLYLANTIHDMRHAKTPEEALTIYSNKNSTISLVQLSQESWDRWRNVPIYNTYVASFAALGVAHEGDDPGDFDRHPATRYADTLVRDLFQLGRPDGALQATSAVALTVVMAFWGTLWEVLLNCQLHHDSDLLVKSLDAAVALWIGAGQERNENQVGYLLYNMAEQAGARFGQDEGETIVNTEFLELVLGLKHDLMAEQCSADKLPGGYAAVRSKVQSLIQNTNVVLVQMLLHHIQDVVDNGSSSDFVEVFSLSLLPQVNGCDSGAFDVLLENTVNNDIGPSTRDATIRALQRSYSCFGIKCSQVGSYEYGLIPECPEEQIVLAGFETLSEINDVAYIDRDLRQMRMAMDMGNWIAAADYYVHGWNSDITFRKMASNSYTWTSSDDMRMYEDFFSNDPTGYGFSDGLVQTALQASSPLATMSDHDRMGVIVGTIQSNIVFLGIIGKIDAALSACDDSLGDEAMQHWEGAAALIIGSTEGPESNGQPDGQSLFSVSKQFCKEFGTCDADTSVVDKILLASWKAGTVSLRLMACEEVEYILTDQVLPNLLIPLLQGLLYYTVQAFTGNSDEAKGYLLAYTQSILPYIQNPDDARILRLNSDQFRGQQNPVNVPGAFAAVKNIVEPLQLDCARVGQIMFNGELKGLCGTVDHPPETVSSPPPPVVSTPTAPVSAPVAAPVLFPVHAPTVQDPIASRTIVPSSKPIPVRAPTTPTVAAGHNLAWGRYTFVNAAVSVQDSQFTLDIKDMYFKQNPKEAWDVYSKPSLNAVHGLSAYTEFRSLQDFSTKASLIMGGDPVYNFFRVALFDDETFDANTTGVDNGWPYADAVENLAIGEENGNSAQLGSKVVTVMEIWMMIAHLLYESVRKCRISIDSSTLLDTAVALWIGQEQEEGKYGSGWSVYSVAQEARELYGLPEAEAKVNGILLDLFEQAQSYASTCVSDTSAGTSLSILVDEIVRNLSIPLLQHLLFHMSGKSFAEILVFGLTILFRQQL